jgi:hypothetical protein
MSCGRLWSTGVGDPERCIESKGHDGAHKSISGSAHYDLLEEWKAQAFRLARLLERECDARGVMPDDVTRELARHERLKKAGPV